MYSKRDLFEYSLAFYSILFEGCAKLCKNIISELYICLRLLCKLPLLKPGSTFDYVFEDMLGYLITSILKAKE